MGVFRKKKKIDKSLWNCLQTDFKNLNADEFEKKIVALYRKKRFHVLQTRPGADQGVDLIARKGRIKIVIQVKNWKNKVTNTAVLKTAGARQMFNANYAMIITSSYFTPSAKKAIRDTPRIRGTDIEGLKRQFRKHFNIVEPTKKSIKEKIKKILTGKRKARRVIKKSKRKF